jgi:hypothetical protein
VKGEFTVRELVGAKTAERMTTLLLDTLSIDSAAAIAFLRNHPRIARGYSQRPQPPIRAPGCCFGEEGALGGLLLAIGSHGNLSIPLPLRGHSVTKRVVGAAC